MNAFFWVAAIFTVLGINISNIVRFWSSASFGERSVLILGLASGAVLLWVDLRVWRRNRAKHYKTPEKVNEYMLRLLKRGGSFAIFANNLSWIRTSPPVRAFLEEQARAGKDVRILVPRHNETTRELRHAGVHILTYSSLSYEPEARFTLLNPKEPGSSLLAIGRGTFPDFYIEEYSDAGHSRVISVVRDLLHIVERVSQREDTDTDH